MTGKWEMPITEAQKKDDIRKKHSAFFAAVRARGILNHMLDGPAKAFESNNPGFRARWEYCPASAVWNSQEKRMVGDTTFIVAREGMGYHVVDASELGEQSQSGQTSGPIKVGDLILLGAPDYIIQAQEEEDARAAYEDFKLPVQSYRDYIRGIKARLPDGTVKETEPVGDVKITQEVLSAPRGGMDHEVTEE